VEKIKQALNLVNRQSAKTDNAAVETPVPPTNRSIEYTRTRKLSLPANRLKSNRIIGPHAPESLVSAYNILRTQILQKLKLNDWNAFGVVSTSAGEGKTLTAINLAISLAKEVRHTVLLVDFDLRAPSVHKYLACDPQYGISDYLLGDAPLPEILLNPGVERLVVLPGLKPMQNSSEVLSSPGVVQLVEELKTRYPDRIVIFDLPSLLTGDDVLAFSPYIEAVLLVIEDGRTGREKLKQALDYLKSTRILGSVLNKSGPGVTL
jgi:capsular exopolysaccharide synthesis family protein